MERGGVQFLSNAPEFGGAHSEAASPVERRFFGERCQEGAARAGAGALPGGTGEAAAPEMSAAARAAAAIGARKREKVKAKEKAEALSGKGYPASNLAFLGTAMLPAQLTSAAVLRRSIKAEWLQHTQSVEGAKGLLLELMKSSANSGHELASATASQMLLLLDFAMPMLRRVGESEYYVLMRRCRKELVRTEEIDVVRFLLLHVVRRRLGIALGVRELDPIVADDLPAVWSECQVLVSLMMRFGAPTPTARNAAHAAAWASLGYENPLRPARVGQRGPDGGRIGGAFDCFALSSRRADPHRLRSCCVLPGKHVPEREMAILRMFADAMGSPVPHLSTKSME
jgi:hypothetical protein